MAIQEAGWAKFNEEKLGARQDISYDRVRGRYEREAAAALGQPRAWPMSEERIEMLKGILTDLENGWSGPAGDDRDIDIIRAMLAEAKQ